MFRPVLLVLLLALPVLLVAFAVLMGGYGLTSATGDAAAAAVLWWIGMALLGLILVDLVLLVGALGVAAVVSDNEDEGGEQESE